MKKSSKGRAIPAKNKATVVVKKPTGRVGGTNPASKFTVKKGK